jgi:dethiobiotin synthetase
VSETLLDVFVTGTDDGVGKTYVCARLAARARAAGLTPAMLTAVQVGDDDATRWLIRRVPGAVGATAHAYPGDQALHSAMRDAGADASDCVDPGHVREVFLALRKRSDGVLVEGPSGLLAPLGDGRTTADLAQALGLPLVIVCRPDRGTVNHAALTIEAAHRRNLVVRGLIVNGASEHPGLDELANRSELARLAPILEIVPDETISSLSG